jgi:uncharacterized alkaline shock family protein YloU
LNKAPRSRIFAQLIRKLTADAVLSVEGVASVRKNGVTFVRDKNTDALIIDVFLNVAEGCKIPEAAWHIQDNVKKRIEAEVDTSVSKVNIHILGVSYKTEKKDAQI